MPAHRPREPRKPRKPAIRVTWEEITAGQLEIMEDECSPVSGEYCAACGGQGKLWTAGDGRRLCTQCGGVYRFSQEPERGEGFWATIIRQLQLAEAAHREEAP